MFFRCIGPKNGSINPDFTGWQQFENAALWVSIGPVKHKSPSLAMAENSIIE
ncbi:hypothetical protein [Bizionia paragorgiae]|uniref:hypothetical protein n=1 Tax=Bizionia paragorgiae TaxID=283786 RepID=UPI00299E3CC5|nr:hypothetical protein [Bizionia paragorgiae]MDX1271464.1 hypothetical protein [Bizionia paragorgiae]